MAAKKKTFDAIEMSRRLREETSALLSAMSRSEKIAFLNRHVAGRLPEAAGRDAASPKPAVAR